MKYLYSREKIDRAIKRIKKFRHCKVYLSDHFDNGLNTVIEVCGLRAEDEGDGENRRRIEKINKILSEELGEDAYLEYYDCLCHVCYVGEDDQVQKGIKYDPIILDGKDLPTYPDPIFFKIQDLWKELALYVGDQGACVIGQHLEFVYKEKYYILEPLDHIQGGIGREKYLDMIEGLLKAVGCQNISFDDGLID